VLLVQGHRRRETIGKESGIFVSIAKTGIPAGEGKFYSHRAVAISTFAAGKFFRKNSSSKAVAAAAARILRLIQSQSGCPRRVGVGEMISPLTLRARLRVLATLKFKYEKQKK